MPATGAALATVLAPGPPAPAPAPAAASAAGTPAPVSSSAAVTYRYAAIKECGKPEKGSGGRGLRAFRQQDRGA